MEDVRNEKFQFLAKMAFNSWFLSDCFWALYPFRTRERWAWNGLAFGTGIWYCADTSISAIYGVTFNIVFNTIMLVLLATPLIFTKKHFTKDLPKNSFTL